MEILNEEEKIIKYINENNLSDILPNSSTSILKLMQFDVNEIIVKANEKVNYLHLLIEGKARISPASEDGKIGFLDFVIKNDVIGDLEYFSKDLYYYDVTALIPCVVIAIPVKYIDTVFNQNVNFYKFICENMSNKMKRTSLKYSKTLLYPIKNQIANYFYELYLKNKRVTLPIMFKETAEFFDISPRYFRSVLVELEEEGVISRSNSGIEIIDVKKLKKYEI